MLMQYCIVYRTGGTENFKWLASLAMSKNEAIESLNDTRKMGYKCYMYKYSDYLAIGKPESFE